MVPSSILLLFLSIALFYSTTASAPSTHDLLEKLGFEKLVKKPHVNYHKKRVVSDTNKARYKIDDYNPEIDSHMFLVKLPPHPPYYTPSKPENLQQNVATKPPIHFRTNGKPAKVYHWNIPVLKNLADTNYKPHKKYNEVIEDSKIYNLKIHVGDKGQYEFTKQKHKKRNNSVKNLRRHEIEDDQMNDVLNDMADTKRGRLEDKPEHIMSIKELAENNYQHMKEKKHANDVMDTDITKIQMAKPKKHKKVNSEPSVYHPAVPKHSFHKYFSGNGKPKSFYVIDKSSKTPSRLHRLLK